MSKFSKRMAAAGICTCMAAALLTGCSAKEDKTVIRVDDTSVSYGLFNLMLRYNQAQMQTMYGSFMGSDMWASYGQSTKDGLVTTMENMLLMEAHMEEYGVSVSEDDQANITKAAEDFVAANTEDVLEAVSGTQENVERLLTLYTIQDRMYDAMIADVDTEVSDEEAAQKTVQYVLFSTADTTDEEGNSVALTDEEKAEKKDQAEQLLEAVKGGADMEEALADIDEELSPVTTSYGESNGSIADELKEVAETLSDGEVADEVIETDSGYYVLQMVTTFDEEATESQKDTIVSQRRSDQYNSLLTEWTDAAEIETDTDLLDDLTFDDTFELKTETETESSTDASTEAASETETGSEVSETTAESGSEDASETAAESEAQTETESAGETETATAEDSSESETAESETAVGTESETAAETESETAAE